MNMVLEMILIGVGFLSVIPVVFLFNTKKSMKYRCLKFLVNSTFVWTVLVFIERISGKLLSTSKDKAFIKNAFGQYLSEDVIKDIIKIE